MTPQEEERLVQIIVQCVRAVLETTEKEAASTDTVLKQGSRFIDVVPQRENDNTQALRNGRQNGYGREDMRESLRRFLRESEPAVPAQATKEEIQQGQAQKRQLVTREDVLVALRQGARVIVLQPDAVVTPLARQVAKEKGVELR
jgi:pyruvate/2-oxoglutarate dehydrogenase complex dihydrolipoamide acyltransferase (E2) component